MDLFFLTTVSTEPTRPARCVGVFEHWEQAEKILVTNQGDLNEGGYYVYALIERCEHLGLCPKLEPVSWFHWEWEVGKWEGCKTPEQFLKVSNFAIG